MGDETRTPQKDPAEGSRKVVEHELERQQGQAEEEGGGRKSQKKPDEGKS
ncbi:hypothetical protein [Phyllobacterium phragmitis]|uniref:Uncharacterized protein n=1 Tax=Phyllobacterium phragmitis TaxID=2670329 RepID=A0ABQ0GZ44_9HYPH